MSTYNEVSLNKPRDVRAIWVLTGNHPYGEQLTEGQTLQYHLFFLFCETSL